jgi:hypothetical protein
MTEPAVAFLVEKPERPAVEVRINFGVLTGREVTPPEIDDLANALRAVAQGLEIVSEERHGFGNAQETAVHQVVLEIAETEDPDGVVAIAERWARACYDARHVEI